MTKKITLPRTLKTKLKDNKDRTLSSRRWLERQLNDPFVNKAKDMGYRSRAAFKFQEINSKFRLLSKGKVVIDLGAAPGGWSQISVDCVKALAPSGAGRVIAMDLQDIEPIPGVTFLKADFTLDETQDKLIEMLDGKADAVISDMAAPACGMTAVDHIRIMNLVEAAYEFAKITLKPGGSFVAKVLRGGTEANLLKELKRSFAKVSHFKPESSRKDSAEMFVVATGFRDV